MASEATFMRSYTGNSSERSELYFKQNMKYAVCDLESFRDCFLSGWVALSRGRMLVRKYEDYRSQLCGLCFWAARNLYEFYSWDRYHRR